MQIRLRTLLIVMTAIAVLVVLTVEILRGPRSVLLGFDRAMQSRFESIKTGDSKEKAIEQLGVPMSVATHFPLEIGYQKNQIPSSQLNQCVEFMTWRNGVNWYYCVGIGPLGTIIVKAEGHS